MVKLPQFSLVWSIDNIVKLTNILLNYVRSTVSGLERIAVNWEQH